MDVFKNGEKHGDDLIEKNYEGGIFGRGINPESRIIEYIGIDNHINALRTLGLNIVLTSGTFDLPHIGHAKYLEKAKSFGDILVVAVDSDEKVKKRKGPERPIVPEDERALMIASLKPTDIVTIKPSHEEKWGLIKLIKPDTLVVTKETYNPEQLEQLSKLCGQVICLEPQATTSTSAQIRKLNVEWGKNIIKPIDEICKENNVDEEVRRKIGEFLLGHKNG